MKIDTEAAAEGCVCVSMAEKGSDVTICCALVLVSQIFHSSRSQELDVNGVEFV